MPIGEQEEAFVKRFIVADKQDRYLSFPVCHNKVRQIPVRESM